MTGRPPFDRPVILEEESTAAGSLADLAPADRLTVVETDDTAPINPVVSVTGTAPRRRARPRMRSRLAVAALLAGLFGLAALMAGLWVEELLAWSTPAGLAAAGFLLLTLTGILVLGAGEVAALSRLSRVQEDRERLGAPGMDRGDLARTLDHLARTLGRVPDLGPGVARWRQGFRPDHPAADMLALFDGTVLAPADAAALVAARRAVRITFGLVAISPTALSDTALFWFRALRLVRQLAEIYGYRPTRATTFLLARRALRDAGLIAGADLAADALGHLLGGKMLERVSAAAAEGAVAAYRMGRFALLVMDACRPLPFQPERRPRLLDLLPTLPD